MLLESGVVYNFSRQSFEFDEGALDDEAIEDADEAGMD